MSANRIIEVADAVVAEINRAIAATGEDGQPIAAVLFRAERTYGREYANAELKELRVDVRHPVVLTAEESRAGSEDLYGLEVAVQMAVNPDDRDAIDTLVILARRIARHFPVTEVLDVEEVPAVEGVQVAENSHSIFDPEKLAQGRFYSLIVLQFREFADA